MYVVRFDPIVCFVGGVEARPFSKDSISYDDFVRPFTSPQLPRWFRVHPLMLRRDIIKVATHRYPLHIQVSSAPPGGLLSVKRPPSRACSSAPRVLRHAHERLSRRATLSTTPHGALRGPLLLLASTPF